MVQPDATVLTLRELHENANALSASAKIKPPWQVLWPLSMSARTGMLSGVARGDFHHRHAQACDAASPAYIVAPTARASSCGSLGTSTAGTCAFIIPP